MNAAAKTEIVTIEPAETPALAPMSEAAAIIQVIERAALNPAVDIDKMERLIAMQERVMARNAKAAFAAALADMQPELPAIAERGGIKDKSGRIQSRYALWEDINEAIKPVLARHGFALSFRVGEEEGKIAVTGVLSHRAGHSEETTMRLPVDTSGSKNPVQSVGSSTSYGKRYTAGALLNLTSRGEDDDGKAGGAVPLGPISTEQFTALQKLIDETKSDTVAICQAAGVEALTDLSTAQYEKVEARLRMKLAARRQA